MNLYSSRLIVDCINRGLKIITSLQPSTRTSDLIEQSDTVFWAGFVSLKLEEGKRLFGTYHPNEIQSLYHFAEQLLDPRTTQAQLNLRGKTYLFGDIHNSNTGGKTLKVTEDGITSYVYITGREGQGNTPHEIRLSTHHSLYCNQQRAVAIEATDQDDMTTVYPFKFYNQDLLISAIVFHNKGLWF
jgi:hypothetical protein